MNQNTPPEISEVVNFLGHIRPFDALSNSELAHTARQIATTYHRAGSDQQILDYENPSLFVVRTGAFDVRDENGQLLDRVTEGGFFGFISLLTGISTGHTLHVHQDGLLHRLDQEAFQNIRHISLAFDHFFTQAFEQRLRVGLRKRAENTAWATSLNEIMAEKLISVLPTSSIQNAAQLMTEKNIASIAIVEGNKLLGIFTDKDCRSRVIAGHVDPSKAISSVMTHSPITIGHKAMVHEATTLMIRHQIKHLPIEKDGETISMVTLSDLIRLQRSDPVLITAEIHRANSIEELVEISAQIPELLLKLITLDVRADNLGRTLTSVTSALTRRLIHLAQRELGPEPTPFAWLAFGSQGRQDQSAKSDQDNGLLIDNSATAADDAYFLKLAQYVNKGLDACGYVYCPGDVMAQNSKWRLTLAEWQAVFENWITQPSSKALMHASIFFDLRPIFVSKGAETLTEQLQTPILKLAQENGIFLSLLTQNALQLSPPLGFFQRLVLDKDDKTKNTLDIKKRGIMPINDIARVHALAHGVSAVNTRERIETLINISAINANDGENLLDAHEYIAHQRLLHQGQQLKLSGSPDNHLDPSQFSALTVRQLKDAFKVVSTSQAGLKQSYSGGLS